MKRLLPSQSTRVWTTLLALGAVLMLARAEMTGPRIDRLIYDVKNDGPNEVGLDLITQNYYEELLKEDREVGRRDFEVVDKLLRRIAGRQPRPDFEQLGTLASIEHETGFLLRSLPPDIDVMHRSVAVRTNRWGHRDDADYDEQPAPGVFRIALIGSSNSLGLGVEEHENFKHHLQRMLNEAEDAPAGFDRYEIVNLSVQGNHLLERVYVTAHIAPQFHPHLILFEVNLLDTRRPMYDALARRVHQGRDLGFDYLREIVRRSGASADDPPLRIEQRLHRFVSEMIIGSFRELARVERETGVPIVPFVLRLDVGGVHPNVNRLAASAEAAGLTTLRIFDAYEGQSGREMYIGERDFHPTAQAHALLAEELYASMIAHPRIGPLLARERTGRNTPHEAGR